MSDTWTESFDDAAVFEVERVNAEWDEWQDELERDRQIDFEYPKEGDVWVTLTSTSSRKPLRR